MTASAQEFFAALDDEGEGRAVGRRHGSPHGLVDGRSDRFPRLLQLSQRGAGWGRGGRSTIRVPIFEHLQCGKRLDIGTAGAAVSTDPQLEAVGAIDRAANG